MNKNDLRYIKTEKIIKESFKKCVEKHGFENIGIRKKYYTNPTEDAVIMVRKVTEDDNSCS